MEIIINTMALNYLQQLALSHVLDGFNIFICGQGGVGKSYLISKIVELSPTETTFITALTGQAALQINGITLHKYSGIGTGEEDVEYLFDNLTQTGRANLKITKRLIIDEISMMSCELFDKLEQLARMVRNNDKPFGGIQLILSGDFFQCPPVKSKNLMFESKNWKIIDKEIELTEIIRQKESLALRFVHALRNSPINESGIIQLPEEWYDFMRYLSRPLKKRKDGILPTRLDCLNVDADKNNLIELNKMDGEEFVFNAIDKGTGNYLRDIQYNCIAQKELKLKIGAQVMLIKNLSETLVNGSRGIITGFTPERYPIVKFISAECIICWETWEIKNRGIVLASRRQIPLKLAWCMTVHKSQGMTIDFLESDIRKAFDFGIFYVALSRFTTLSKFRIIGFDPMKLLVNPKVKKFMEKLSQKILDENNCNQKVNILQEKLEIKE